MKFNVAAQLTDGTWMQRQNTEFTFDADNGVLYLFDDEGGQAFINFDHCLQIGATQVSN